jgi:uncharacterized protein HemX
MAEGRSLTPRIRMPKVTLPGRSDSGSRPRGKSPPATETKPQPKAGNGGKSDEAKTKETTKEGEKPTAAKGTAGTKAPEPNLQERMEGLQGWMAEIERKQGRMTYFGIAGIVIAILASGAAIYLGLTAKSDSATKGDLDELTKRIDSLEAAATKNSKDTQAALNSSVAQLQQSIASVQKQQSQNAANISTLQSQAAAGALSKGAATGTTVTPTPGTTTTTPAGK